MLLLWLFLFSCVNLVHHKVLFAGSVWRKEWMFEFFVCFCVKSFLRQNSECLRCSLDGFLQQKCCAFTLLSYLYPCPQCTVGCYWPLSYDFVFICVTSLSQHPRWSPLTSRPPRPLTRGGNTSGSTAGGMRTGRRWLQQPERRGHTSETHKQVTTRAGVGSQQPGFLCSNSALNMLLVLTDICTYDCLWNKGDVMWSVLFLFRCWVMDSLF